MDTERSNLRPSKIEFDVNMTCKNCASKIENVLSSLKNIDSFSISVEKQSVVVETSLPSEMIKEAIENTGKRAVLKGFGTGGIGSAVAELKQNGVLGVVRFHQISDHSCMVDGTIDGLSPGEHGFHIYEFGDLSKGCDSIGSHFNPSGHAHGGPLNELRHYGDMGNVIADENGRASFHFEDSVIKVWDIIGRSVAVTARKDDLGTGKDEASKVDGNSGQRLACAIIARSAGLFENPKRLCQCDGISIWDEQKVPSASL